jgi:uncharacterized protein (DUF1330 family)
MPKRESENPLRAYAFAHLRSTRMGPPIVEYLERIDATLEPYGGRFIVHGGEVEVLEGEFPGGLVVIEFPNREAARSWYDSPAYQEIIHLRTENSEGSAGLVDGVGSRYRAADVLSS